MAASIPSLRALFFDIRGPSAPVNTLPTIHLPSLFTMGRSRNRGPSTTVPVTTTTGSSVPHIPAQSLEHDTHSEKTILSNDNINLTTIASNTTSKDGQEMKMDGKMT
jgi:hypothetical protein